MMQSSCNLNLPPISSTSQNIKAYVLTISHSFDTDYFPCNMNSKHLFALASRLFGFCCKLCHCISHHYSITNQEDISKLVVLGIFNIEKKQQPAIIDCGTYFVPYAIICIKCVNSLSFVIFVLFCSRVNWDIHVVLQFSRHCGLYIKVSLDSFPHNINSSSGNNNSFISTCHTVYKPNHSAGHSL